MPLDRRGGAGVRGPPGVYKRLLDLTPDRGGDPMSLTPGGAKSSLALTTLRAETLADMNRGRLRGWALLGAVLSAVIGALAWPDLLAVITAIGLATLLVVTAVWIHLSLRDAEKPMSPGEEAMETRDSTTGEYD